MEHKIKKLRPYLNLSQLAREMGVTQQYVSNLFTGREVNYKRFSQIKRILKREFKVIAE